MKSTKKFMNKIIPTKKLLLGLGSLSLACMGAFTKTEAAQQSRSQLESPLSVSKATVNKVIQQLKAASNGTVTAASVEAAIQTVRAENPGISQSVMAASLTQLGLDQDGMKNAILGLSSTYNVSASEAASVVISEAYLNEGKSFATSLITNLKESLGDTVVENALVISSANPALDASPPDVAMDSGIGGSNSPYYG